ncbi:ATP-binding protein [Edaphobacter albus]|uniref:ATP-binding protein n=1 Tax=Edaphobacter sp. 4G125 TaxID=2763071 RepID=UPI0016464492|nr:ATP-binding protein [Edaphobacter sp. 4G125]QNI35865.1 ATP-binding protein [Edaphobacter sp. 4G125]
MIETNPTLEDSIFRIGKVISVDGRLVRVKVDKTKNTSHLLYKGELLRNISVGGYIKIVKGFTTIIGKVEGEFVQEDKVFVKSEYGSERERVSRTLNVSLLGFFKSNKFVRGIKEMPLIDNECFLLHVEEFSQVHNFITPGDQPITLGRLAFERGQDIQVGINGLFASHIGIFGNTGSGKSYTLAKIYRELFARYKDSPNFQKRARFLLIDFNGEYVSEDDNVIVEKEHKHVFKLSTRDDDGDRLPVPRETIDDAKFWVVFLEATEKTQAPFLTRSVESKFLQKKVQDAALLRSYIADTIYAATIANDRNLEKGTILNFLEELTECFPNNESLRTLILDYRDNLQFNGTTRNYYYDDGNFSCYSNQDPFKIEVVYDKVNALALDIDALTPIDQVRLRIVLRYYDEIVKGFSNREHLAPLLKRMDRRIDDLKRVICLQEETPVEAAAKNLRVISLKDVNVQIRKVLPLLICKQLYDDKKNENDPRCYLNLIVDEAHNILSESSERESEQWKDYRLEVFEEIIKEGRKFGTFLTIASQRPSDISATIISQLHNYFLHRLINNQDIKAVERTVSYLDKVSFESLPILPTGTCVFAGLIASVPVVVDIGAIVEKYEPKNKTMTLIDQWEPGPVSSPETT